MENTISDMNWLYEGFKAAMSCSPWKEEPQRFEIDFLSQLTYLSNELDDRTYKTMPGSEFPIRERGKERYIHGNRTRDKIVRHCLCDNTLADALQPYQIYNNGASQKGKGISFSRRIFERDLHNYYLKHGSNKGFVCFVDFSKYYDNIRHDKAKELILPKLDEFSAWLFENIVDTFKIDVSYMSDEEYEHCLDECFNSITYHEQHTPEELTGKKFMAKSFDIGDQVSQSVGVFFPTRIDNYVKIVRWCKFCGRYMDDLYFIVKTRDEAKSIIAGIKEEARNLGIFINDSKTQIVPLSHTFTYLKIRYSLDDNGKVIKRISPETVTRQRQKLKAYKRLLDRKEMAYIQIENAYKSWMGSFAPIMSKKQIKHMKSLYFELFGKDVRWKKIPSHSHSQTGKKSPVQSTGTTTSPGMKSQSQTSQTSTLSEQPSTGLPW